MSVSLPLYKPAPAISTGAAAPWFHVIEGSRPVAFLVGGSRIFEIDGAFAERLVANESLAMDQLRQYEVPRPPRERAGYLAEPASISLNLAQICNLACSYCYADEGRFGGAPRTMSGEVAFRAIDRLVDSAAGRRVTVGFIGGEPFLHRELMYRSVAYGTRRAAESSTPIAFSVATNGTLLDADDVALLRAHDFAVSVSMDGGEEIHDRHRPGRRGSGSHARALAAIAPLLDSPGRARVAARATVTRDDLAVADRVGALLEKGFLEVGVSPARSGPDPSLILRGEDWPRLLDAMRVAAEADIHRMRARGESSLRFSNFAIALKEIHRGSCRPLPCGSARSYVSVGADGRYYSCHRTIGVKEFELGDVDSGLSATLREHFVHTRDVDLQEPCRGCWARYLCGGGCHAEVASNGREGCDYIRGWLEFCLARYNELLETAPHLFAEPGEIS